MTSILENFQNQFDLLLEEAVKGYSQKNKEKLRAEFRSFGLGAIRLWQEEEERKAEEERLRQEEKKAELAREARERELMENEDCEFIQVKKLKTKKIVVEAGKTEYHQDAKNIKKPREKKEKVEKPKTERKSNSINSQTNTNKDWNKYPDGLNSFEIGEEVMVIHTYLITDGKEEGRISTRMARKGRIEKINAKSVRIGLYKYDNEEEPSKLIWSDEIGIYTNIEIPWLYKVVKRGKSEYYDSMFDNGEFPINLEKCVPY